MRHRNLAPPRIGFRSDRRPPARASCRHDQKRQSAFPPACSQRLYLRLGQPATELSGGEAQRIKLATELQRIQCGNTLYILDEPTTGLHPADVERLVVQLDGLVEAGNTVIGVEHDMRIVAAATG